jgi:hypothetical protein
MDELCHRAQRLDRSLELTNPQKCRKSRLMTVADDRKGNVMNMHARKGEPDLGSLLELIEDEPELETASEDRHEPRLFAPEKPTAKQGNDGSGKTGLSLGAADRFGQSAPVASSRKTRRDIHEDDDDASLAARVLTLWGGFWRAVVIGIVAGTVGGIVGAFTLVWLTGAGWTTFAKLLIDAIGRL